MAENTVFLLLTAIIRNFYKFLMGRLDTKAFGLKKTSRIKAFVFKFRKPWRKMRFVHRKAHCTMSCVYRALASSNVVQGCVYKK